MAFHLPSVELLPSHNQMNTVLRIVYVYWESSCSDMLIMYNVEFCNTIYPQKWSHLEYDFIILTLNLKSESS